MRIVIQIILDDVAYPYGLAVNISSKEDHKCAFVTVLPLVLSYKCLCAFRVVIAFLIAVAYYVPAEIFETLVYVAFYRIVFVKSKFECIIGRSEQGFQFCIDLYRIYEIFAVFFFPFFDETFVDVYICK